MQDIHSKSKYMECLDNVSLRLDALSNAILTMYVGLENENVQQQALDTIECIMFCVECIRTRLDEELKQ